MIARAVGFILIIFLASCLTYLYGLQTGCLGLYVLRALIWGNIGVASLVIVLYVGFDGTFLSLFINTFLAAFFAISLVSVLINLMILNNNPYYAISVFLFGTALAVFLIVINGWRHGYFKDRHENE